MKVCGWKNGRANGRRVFHIYMSFSGWSKARKSECLSWKLAPFTEKNGLFILYEGECEEETEMLNFMRAAYKCLRSWSLRVFGKVCDAWLPANFLIELGRIEMLMGNFRRVRSAFNRGSWGIIFVNMRWILMFDQYVVLLYVSSYRILSWQKWNGT